MSPLSNLYVASSVLLCLQVVEFLFCVVESPISHMKMNSLVQCRGTMFRILFQIVCLFKKLWKEILTHFFISKTFAHDAYICYGILIEWKQKVLGFVKLKMEALPLGHGSVSSLGFLPHVDSKHLTRFQHSLVITSMYKCRSDILFVCQKHYISSLMVSQVCQNLSFKS
jgi:hypothetical protein